MLKKLHRIGFDDSDLLANAERLGLGLQMPRDLATEFHHGRPLGSSGDRLDTHRPGPGKEVENAGPRNVFA